MQDMIQRILEIDKQARDMTAQAEERRRNAKQEIEAQVQKIRQHYQQQAQIELEKIREREEQLAQETMERQESENKRHLQMLDEQFKEHGDEWIDQIVTRTIHS